MVMEIINGKLKDLCFKLLDVHFIKIWTKHYPIDVYCHGLSVDHKAHFNNEVLDVVSKFLIDNIALDKSQSDNITKDYFYNVYLCHDD